MFQTVWLRDLKEVAYMQHYSCPNFDVNELCCQVVCGFCVSLGLLTQLLPYDRFFPKLSPEDINRIALIAHTIQPTPVSAPTLCSPTRSRMGPPGTINPLSLRMAGFISLQSLLTLYLVFLVSVFNHIPDFWWLLVSLT